MNKTMCYIIYNYTEDTLFSYFENGEPVWTEKVNMAYKTYNHGQACLTFYKLQDAYNVNLLSIDVLK